MEAVQSSVRSLSILVVDDDPVARKLIGLMLGKKFPHAAIGVAGSGQQGLDLFSEQSCDIVITDINMPGMDGIQMAGAIKALNADTRFIVLTGYSDLDHLDQVGAIGASDYIVKPIEFKKLFAAIAKCQDDMGLNDDESALRLA
jgi:YesN/AraC family two-component response regulator